ncbi:2'-5' RNA ligase family protein [Azotobacter sp. CWF10]
MSIKSLRLFFGLPLPHRQADAIDAWRNGLGLDGRLVARRNLHLTLAFLGSQPVERLEELQQLAGRIRLEGFELKLDRLEAGRHGLVSLGTGQPPEALLQLAGSCTGYCAVPATPSTSVYSGHISPWPGTAGNVRSPTVSRTSAGRPNASSCSTRRATNRVLSITPCSTGRWPCRASERAARQSSSRRATRCRDSRALRSRWKARKYLFTLFT